MLSSSAVAQSYLHRHQTLDSSYGVWTAAHYAGTMVHYAAEQVEGDGLLNPVGVDASVAPW